MAALLKAGLAALALSLSVTARGAEAQSPASAAPETPVALTPEHNACDAAAGPVALGSALWNGWGRDPDNTRYQPEPALRASDVPKLALRWAYGYQAGREFGQPTVVDGRLFLVSSTGRAYSLDAKTGCTYWTYDAQAALRSASVIGELARGRVVTLPKKIKRTLAHLDVIKAPSAVFFGGDGGMVYALDAQRGTLLWKTQIESHPLARVSATPVVNGDRLYVAVSSSEDRASLEAGYSCCTFRGSAAALDMATGRVVWKSFTVLEEPQPTRRSAGGIQEFGPAGAAVFSAPTLDLKRKAVYVTTMGSSTGVEQALTDAVVAFDLTDGKLRWVKQLTRPDTGAVGAGFTSSPLLRTLATGNQVILAGQRSGVVYGLDPDHGGAVLWQSRLAGAVSAGAPGGPAAGGVVWGSAADHRLLYVAASGAVAQPPNASGTLSALDLATGTARWRTAAPAPACAARDTPCVHGQAQAVTVIPGSAFSGSMDGHLRAYSTIDGKILWDYDTVRDFTTRNGVKASGGGLDRGGPTIVNGMLYVNSGNALLAFSVDGK